MIFFKNQPLSLEMLGHGGQVTLKQATKEGGWEKSKLHIGLGYETSLTILKAITCTRRKLLGIKISWKIWCCMLPKVSYRKSLVVVLSLALVSLYGVSELKTHCCTLSLTRWQNPWKTMSYQL
jgi:hypothetical protein